MAYEWIMREPAPRELCRIYIGTRLAGPILQYDAASEDKWDGSAHRHMQGAWTPVYSRGDYGRNYSHGGHWSGHTNNLLTSIGVAPLHQPKDMTCELGCFGGEIISLPGEIKGDISMMDLDCSGSWAIWYPSAIVALRARLSPAEIQKANLPPKTKIHLGLNETLNIIDLVFEVIQAHKT